MWREAGALSIIKGLSLINLLCPHVYELVGPTHHFCCSVFLGEIWRTQNVSGAHFYSALADHLLLPLSNPNPLRWGYNALVCLRKQQVQSLVFSLITWTCQNTWLKFQMAKIAFHLEAYMWSPLLFSWRNILWRCSSNLLTIAQLWMCSLLCY